MICIGLAWTIIEPEIIASSVIAVTMKQVTTNTAEHAASCWQHGYVQATVS